VYHLFNRTTRGHKLCAPSLPYVQVTSRGAMCAVGNEVIMSIAGHVLRAMLSRYSHVRMKAKRRALDEIAARQRVADEKRYRKSNGNSRLRALHYHRRFSND
jgi:hypothetical protein